MSSGWGIFGQVAADLAGQAFSAHQAHNANRAMINFQREMMSTKYQRQVEDMKKAGLNPMLSVMNPASTPGSPHLMNPGAGAEGFGSRTGVAAANTALMLAMVDKTKAEAEKTRAEIPNVGILGQNLQLEGSRIASDIGRIDSDASLNAVKERLMSLEADKLKQLIPWLVRFEKANTLRKEVGMDSVERMNKSEVEFWDWLHSVGEKLGEGVDFSHGPARAVGAKVKELGGKIKEKFK